MDKKNLMPQAAQPVNRSTTGQLPDVLAELSEEALQLHGDDANAAAVFALGTTCSGQQWSWCFCWCSYDGDDAE
jgi:bacteriocin leader peptide (microcyclamide/patellamide family)